MKDLIVCKRCVLDTTVEDIVFDENGICNYCHSYDDIVKTIPQGSEAIKHLEQLVQKIKLDGKGSEYDCIIGLSGGVDSTYLAHMVIKQGLRPLAVHVDTGWNSEIAVSNIENVVNKLGIDLYTVVIDWEEMKDLQRSYFLASVPDCDVPQDHVFPAVLSKIASSKGIKHSISGHNIVTEYVLPRNWSYDSNDLVQLKEIHKKYGKSRLKKYPTISLFDRTIKYKFITPLNTHRFLYYVPYNKESVKEFIQSELGWRDYGGKHFESKFTKFFQAYYLKEKFGFDKRKAHLSNLIVSKQITRQQALIELEKEQYTDIELCEDIEFICSKLDFTEKEWRRIMESAPRKHSEFSSDKNVLWYRIYKSMVRKIKND